MKKLANQQVQLMNEFEQVKKKISQYYEINKHYDLAYFKIYEVSDYGKEATIEYVHYDVLIYVPLKMQRCSGKNEYISIRYIELFNEEVQIRIELEIYSYEEYIDKLKEYDYYY